MLVKLLEPAMLLVMGAVILFIMVALLLPVMMAAGSLG
jgi:type II secretory pathway component PulF